MEDKPSAPVNKNTLQYVVLFPQRSLFDQIYTGI